MDKLDILNKIEARHKLPIFYQSIWYESFEPDSWDLAISGTAEDPKGIWPYFIRRKMGFTKVTMPWLQPYGGPFLFYPVGQKAYARLSFEKKEFEELHAQLPKHDALAFNLHPNYQNHLPFKWLGMDQTTQYTYVLDLEQAVDELQAGLNGNIRREISKAIRNGIKIEVSSDLSDLHRLKVLDYENKGIELGYSEADFKHRFERILNAGKATILYAKDGEKIVSGILLVWDELEAYYLVGATDPANKGSGIFSHLLFEAIVEAQKQVKVFNFEGSVIEPIEKFFRSFGSTQVPYHVLHQYTNKKLKALEKLRK
jgi:hypothetical protein